MAKKVSSLVKYKKWLKRLKVFEKGLRKASKEIKETMTNFQKEIAKVDKRR